MYLLIAATYKEVNSLNVTKQKLSSLYTRKEKTKDTILCSIEMEYSKKSVWVNVHYETISHKQHYSKGRQLSILCRCRYDIIAYHKNKKSFQYENFKTSMVRLLLLLSNHESKCDKSCKSINIIAQRMNFLCD